MPTLIFSGLKLLMVFTFIVFSVRKSIIVHIAELFLCLSLLTVYLFLDILELSEFICWTFSFYWCISCD